MKIVSVAQMQEIERTADESGLSYQEMMMNAGQGVAEWVYKRFPKAPSVIGLVGSGNNGGDTLVALAMLSQWGFRTTGFILKERDEDELSQSYTNTGGNLINISDEEKLEYLRSAMGPETIILDGILGTGLKLPLRGQLATVMGSAYQLIENRPGVSVIAVDCPSGIDCDTGEASGATLTADHTLTMAAVKQGLLKHPARGKSGDIHLIDIGIGDISKYLSIQVPEMISKEMAKESLPERPVEGHKGTFGTCFVIAGTPNFTGAAYLTGKAAYRGGCGLVHLATLGSVQRSLSGQLVEAVWTILPDMDGYYDPSGVDLLDDEITNVESLVIGPGWGLSDDNKNFLEKLLAIIPAELPAVFDADGLKLLSEVPQWQRLVPKHTILTPHPGEMAILTNLDIDDIQSHRWEVAKEYSEKWGVMLVLKGAETVIANDEGKLWINPVSDPALATAGSGDVLSGLLGGLLAQGLSTEKTAVLSTYLHSQAGLIAKENAGTDRSITAVDILDSLSESFSLMNKK